MVRLHHMGIASRMHDRIFREICRISFLMISLLSQSMISRLGPTVRFLNLPFLYQSTVSLHISVIT